ncbi:hypothetical protein IDH27_03200 [Pelagibacterales bacterium SAG-MED46]|nr:hypothetical protein [Pelagibacterales bacterium SAG-MED46]
MSKHYIIGDGQFAELLKQLLVDENITQPHKIFFVTKKKIKKKNFIHENDFLLIKEKLNIFIGIGNIKKRLNIIKKFNKKNHNFPNFISKSANLMKKCIIGRGNIILPNSIIQFPGKIEDHNIVGTGSVILHHTHISSNCIIGGGASIGAGTKIGKNVFIGVGSIIASNATNKNIKIGNYVFVCSGSVVLSSVSSNSKVIGNPARKIL